MTAPFQSPRERLYNLLPAIYRLRDHYDGEPLRALMAVLEQIFDEVEADLDQLADNWFIETCAAELIPYIGDLVGIEVYPAFDTLIASDRKLVGNAFRWRRRKGTASVLPEMLKAVTGWHVRVREYGGMLAMTQHVKDVNAGGRLASMREPDEFHRQGGLVETTARTANVRYAGFERPVPAAGELPVQGQYNLNFVGISCWRLQAFEVTWREPTPIPGPDGNREDGTYAIHPFGIRAPLFNRGVSTDPAALQSIPAPLDPGFLRDELDSRILRAAGAEDEDGSAAGPLWFGDNPVLDILAQWPGSTEYERVDPVCLLPESAGYRPRHTDPSHHKRGRVSVRTDTGILRFLDRPFPQKVRVTYSYGFSADLGGGPYQRFEQEPAAGIPWIALVVPSRNGSFAVTASGVMECSDIDAALEAWESSGSAEGCICIADSAIHEYRRAEFLQLNGRSLTISGWDGAVPTLRGCLRVAGQVGEVADSHCAPQPRQGRPSSFHLNGVWLEGSLHLSGQLAVGVVDCTIFPTSFHQSDTAGPEAAILARVSLDSTISITRSIIGPIRLPSGSGCSLELADSILDGRSSGVAVCSFDGQPGPQTAVRTCTVFGAMRVEALSRAELSIFTGPVTVAERNHGSATLCWFAPGSVTPNQVRCVPEADTPAFTSTRHGDPGYAQLSVGCPSAFFSISGDGGELGAFHRLGQPLRKARLKTTLEETLPFHLEPQIFYET